MARLKNDKIKEETNIQIKDYTLLHNINPISSINSDNKTIYITNYFIGYLKNTSTYKPLICLNNKNQISEISDINWFNLNDIKRKKSTINPYINKKYIYVENIFKLIINKFKKNIKIGYYKEDIH